MCKNKKILIYILTFSGLILIDQLSKYLIRYFGGFYICNKGIAFGVGINSILFWLAASLILFIVIYALSANSKPKLLNSSLFVILALILIIAGAISNIIDRLIYGCVTDFIDFKFWPSFNLADAFIVLGVLILLAKYPKL